MRLTKILAVTTFLLLLTSFATPAFAGTLTSVVIGTEQEGDLEVDLSEYATALMLDSLAGDPMLDFLRGSSQSPNIKAVRSGDSFYSLIDFAVNFQIEGTLGGALQRSTPLPTSEIAGFRKLESFDSTSGIPVIVEVEMSAGESDKFEVIDIF